MRKKMILGSVLLLMITISFGQDIAEKKGLIKATATFSFGKFLDDIESADYIHGHLEYFPENNISLRGDGYYSLYQHHGLYGRFDAISGATTYINLNYNHTLLFGALYHFFDQKKINPYIGFQPGLNFTQIEFQEHIIDQVIKSRNQLVPVITITGGANLYVGKYFNFFASIRYLNGKFMNRYPVTINLSELRLSAGLGFNLQTRKE